MVLHAPPIKHRFWEFELLDPWTNDFYNITSGDRTTGPGSWGVTHGGNWAVVGPHFKGKLPKDVTRVSSRYDRVWVIGRTFVRNQADLVNVHKIQNEYSITPLSKFGSRLDRTAAPKKRISNAPETTIPGTQPGEDPIQFFVALDKELKLFPPPARDKPLLAKLRPYGIGAGLDPLKAGLSAAALQGLRDAVTNGPNAVQSAALALYLKGFAAHNGYLITDLGAWGTNYTLRAIGDKIGLGGQRAGVATYPGRAARRHQGTADRIQALCAPPRQEPATDPSACVLVADDVQQPVVLRRQPPEPLPAQRPLPPPQERGRLGRHLRPVEPAEQPGPSQQLAARHRRRVRASGSSGGSMTSARRSPGF